MLTSLLGKFTAVKNFSVFEWQIACLRPLHKCITDFQAMHSIDNLKKTRGLTAIHIQYKLLLFYNPNLKGYTDDMSLKRNIQNIKKFIDDLLVE